MKVPDPRRKQGENSAHKASFPTYAKLFMTAVFWGGTFIAGRHIAQGVGPFSAAFLRFTVASMLLVLLVLRAEGRLPSVQKGQIIPLILLGMTGVFSYNVFFFKGLKLIQAGRASVIIANNPIVIALFAALIFKEKLTVLKVMGIVLSVIGAIIVVSKGHVAELFRGGLGWGEIFILCCVASWACYSLIGKVVMARLSPLVAVAYSSAVGAGALFVPAWAEGLFADISSYTILDWLGIAYLGIFGTVIGFVWYYEGIKAIGPTRAGQFINFVPMSAIVLAFFILGEAITVSLLVGTAFVITGVYVTNAKF
jgi:drug/metabolite transporter (DMT)-like permease